MAAKFNGFTQEDINKISGKTSTASSTTQSVKTAGKPAVFGRGIRRMPDKTSSLKSDNSTKSKSTAITPAPKAMKEVKTDAIAITDSTLPEINLDESMSTSIEDALFFGPLKKLAREQKSHDDEVSPPSETNGHSDKVNESSNLDDSSILPDIRVDNAPFKGVSLKDFESHRKIIEEQNKQKKQMLYKAIEHHSQKTAAETKKIEEIKSELAKLDNDLAADVGILRKQIESACIHYANIEKQYNRIEAQFLRAKLDLHNACEKKELLTEHLCTVIAHNEDRKAKKLSELMEKVGLSPAGELEDSSIYYDDSVDK